MITMKMQGGLGNQMFQYAAGYAMARRLGVELALDISSFTWDRQRQFNLDLFSIPNKIVRGAVRTIEEYDLRWEKWQTDSVKDGAVLSGYFQDERYFSEYRTELTNLFQSRKALPFGYEYYMQDAAKSNSIALTIRRGDYLDKQQYHGVLPADYYRSALDYMVHMTPVSAYGLDLIIFSDDIAWCRKNLMLSTNFSSMTFIDNDMTTRDHMGREDADIWVMKCCRGHILANSTFSWWGAWLSGSDRVVAPKRWFTADITHHIVPDRWVTL